MYKRVAARPDWLKAKTVLDVYSLSHCISDDFADYINYWKHNGYWLFNSPEVIEEIATNEGIDLSESTLFYYEVYEYEFDENSNGWSAFKPEPSFVTNVQMPMDKQLEGFDVTTFCAHTSPECSPLSCNSLATTIPVNKHCLFNSFEEAKQAIDGGLFRNSEPGPYRIFATYTVKNGLTNHSTGPARIAAHAG
ncbi:MAG TPA: hypothetical protein VM166_11170 [Gemmatimonadaceae bacterium]|nr:hypothetical protein [Gemmatimonadaceae bacterium]